MLKGGSAFLFPRIDKTYYKMKKPLWHKILKHQLDNKFIENGLTIPYLAGCYNHIMHTELDDCINKLISDIEKSETDNEIAKLMMCPDRGVYVIALEARDITKIFHSKQPKLTNDSGEESLLITMTATTLGSSSEEIKSRLNEMYRDIIQAMTFSIEREYRGKWIKFDDKELKRIEEGSKYLE